jgi:hypothetical protein
MHFKARRQMKQVLDTAMEHLMVKSAALVLALTLILAKWSLAKADDVGNQPQMDMCKAPHLSTHVDCPPGTNIAQQSRGIDIRAAPYGAKCDGRTDDSAAIRAADAAATAKGNTALLFPDAVCRVKSTVANTGNTWLGVSISPSNPPTGSTILCDANVTPCVKTTPHSASTFRRLLIKRSGSTPPKDFKGLYVDNGGLVSIEDVFIYNHGQAYYFDGNRSGLGAVMTRAYAGKISGDYITVDGWPELRIAQSRMGMNGTGDYRAHSFITIKGGVSHTAGGPNTISIQDTQFNQGSNPVTHWLNFSALSAPGVPAVDARIFSFIQVHVEGLSGAAIVSDSTWNVIQDLSIVRSEINAPSIATFALSPATYIDNWNIIASEFHTSSFSLAPAPLSGNSINRFNMTDTQSDGPVTLSASRGSGNTASLKGNKLGSGLTVAGTWSGLSLSANQYLQGDLTMAATGNMSVQDPKLPVIFKDTYTGWFDINGSLLLGFNSSQGGYRLQINGPTLQQGLLQAQGNVNMPGVSTEVSNITGSLCIGPGGAVIYKAASNCF